MKRPSQASLPLLTAMVAVVTVAEPPGPPCWSIDTPHQCACNTSNIGPVDSIVRRYLTSGYGTPVARRDTTNGPGYLVLATVTDTSWRYDDGSRSCCFPASYRFRVDAWWARPTVPSVIGATISLRSGEEFCGPARYNIGQQYLLYVGSGQNRFRNLIGCAVVFPTDSGQTRRAIAVLDSALIRH